MRDWLDKDRIVKSAKTTSDQYLEEQLRDTDFASRFAAAGKAWDVALQITALRESRGLSQKQLAERAATTQQQISRLESRSYQGHSLSILRRVAEALGTKLVVQFSDTPVTLIKAKRPTPFRKDTTVKRCRSAEKSDDPTRHH